MNASHISLSSLLSFCQKFSQLTEIWDTVYNRMAIVSSSVIWHSVASVIMSIMTQCHHVYYDTVSRASSSLECMELIVVMTLLWLWSTAFSRNSNHELSASVVKLRHLEQSQHMKYYVNRLIHLSVIRLMHHSLQQCDTVSHIDHLTSTQITIRS